MCNPRKHDCAAMRSIAAAPAQLQETRDAHLDTNQGNPASQAARRSGRCAGSSCTPLVQDFSPGLPSTHAPAQVKLLGLRGCVQAVALRSGSLQSLVFCLMDGSALTWQNPCRWSPRGNHGRTKSVSSLLRISGMLPRSLGLQTHVTKPACSQNIVAHIGIFQSSGVRV